MINTMNALNCSDSSSTITTTLHKVISESDNLITALENVGGMYGIPSSNIIVDDSLKSIKVVGDNIIAPSKKNTTGNTKAIMCGIGAVLDNISRRIDDKLTEFQLNNIDTEKQSSTRRFSSPSKGTIIERCTDDNGDEVLVYDSGFIDHADTLEGRRKAKEIYQPHGLTHNRVAYFSDEDDITQGVDITSDSEPTSSEIQDVDVSSTIGESSSYIDIISQFNDTRNLGSVLLNYQGFDYVKTIQESESSKKKLKEIKPEDIKYMKFDNTYILKAIKYFNDARTEQSTVSHGKWNKSDFINNANYQKAIDCLNKQFNCRINVRFFTDSETRNNLYTSIFNDIKNNISISKSKGFQLNGLPIDIFVINESIDEEMSKDTDIELFGQFMVSSILHEIFHNIYAILFREKVEFKALLESTIGLATSVENVKKRRIILTNYVNTLNEMNGNKIGRFIRRRLVKQLMCVVSFQHDEKMLEILKRKTTENIDSNDDTDKEIDELIRIYQEYINKHKFRKRSKLIKVFSVMLGAILCVTPLVPLGVHILKNEKKKKAEEIEKEKAINEYKNNKNFEEYYCDLFAGMYKLPTVFLINYKHKYTSNSIDREKLNKLALLEKEIYEINLSSYPTTEERNFASVKVAQNLLEIDEDLEPCVKKYLSWIVNNHSSILDTDIKEIYNTTTFDPKTAENLDNHLQNLISNGITLTESDISWIFDGSIICESSDRVNDEGVTVPERCPKCGSDIKMYLKGEPVWLCSNKKCNTYFGTAPCCLEQEIISDIDNIETVTLEAEYNVLSTLVDCYYKQSLIMEYYNGDNINDFSIFQEGFSDIINTAKGDSSENLFIRILKFIPRLIGAIIKAIKNSWDNRKSQQLIKKIEQLEKLTYEQRRAINELVKNENNKSDIYNELDKRVKKAEIKINYEIDKMKQQVVDLNNKIDIISNTVKTDLNFTETIEFFENILKAFDILEKWDFNKPNTMNKNSTNKLKALGITTPNIIGGGLKNYNFDDIKRYIREISELYKEINVKGSSIQNKFSQFAKEYESKKKTNQAQTERYSILTLAMSDVSKYLTMAKTYADTAVTAFQKLEEGFDKYGQYTHKV